MKKSLLTLFALAAGALLTRADTLVIKGSDTLGAKLVPQLAEEFKAQHPGTAFNIAAEGSTTSIAAIIDGTAQIGMSSRPTKPEEISAAKAKGGAETEGGRAGGQIAELLVSHCGSIGFGCGARSRAEGGSAQDAKNRRTKGGNRRRTSAAAAPRGRAAPARA